MAKRYSVPLAETKYSWLKTILDTYYISDAQVEEHLVKISKKGLSAACHEGCQACCLKPTVPITELELRAISWYTSEVLAGELRQVIKQRLDEHKSRLECPFLVDSKCSIYPVRPLICRQFLVKTKPCKIGEDVLETRPEDIIQLDRESVIRPVAMRLLDHYQFKSSTAKRKAFESGFIAKNARDMHTYDWSLIANSMRFFDNAVYPVNQVNT